MNRILIASILYLILFLTNGFCQELEKKSYSIISYRINSTEKYLKTTENKTLCNQKDTMVYIDTIEIPNADWLRIIFSDFNLGKKSYVFLQSISDSSTQKHTQTSLNNWRRKSAIFNGGKIEVKLFIDKNDFNVFFQIDSIIIGNKSPENKILKSICGSIDNRGVTNNPRVGRMTRDGFNYGYCTVWLVANGAILTAGHCVDPNEDSFIDLVAGDIIEFNVPESDADGEINAADADDQYPIDINNIIYPGSHPLGADWAILQCLPNANDELPHQKQGEFFRVTKVNPSLNSSVRVTGYGLDDIPEGSGPPVWDGSEWRYLNNWGMHLKHIKIINKLGVYEYPEKSNGI